MSEEQSGWRRRRDEAAAKTMRREGKENDWSPFGCEREVRVWKAASR
jgi:hypothetical protein